MSTHRRSAIAKESEAGQPATSNLNEGMKALNGLANYGESSRSASAVIQMEDDLPMPQFIDLRGNGDLVNRINVKSPDADGATRDETSFTAHERVFQESGRRLERTMSSGDLQPENRDGIQEAEEAPRRRYHSARSAARVNRANMEAKIRRFQQRHHRPPRRSTAVNCIRSFLSLLYYICMTPFKPSSAQRLPKYIQVLQNILYWLFAIISVAQALIHLKFAWLNFRNEDDMLSFVAFGFHAAHILTKTCNVYLFWTKTEDTSKLLEKIDKANARETHNTTTAAKILPCAIGILSILMVGISTVFGNFPFDIWTFKDALLDQSFEMSQFLLMWTPVNFENSTDNLIEKYGLVLNWTTGLFAAAGDIIYFLGTLHSCLILDLLPIITFQIKFLQAPLSSHMRRSKAQSTKCALSENWNHYKEVVGICNHMDALLGKQIKLIHLQNVLLFGNFLRQLLQKDRMNAEFLIDFISIIKVLVTYYLAQDLAEENTLYEDCVTDCPNVGTTMEIDGKEKDPLLVVMYMIQHRIGVGRNNFYVDETFVLKFLLMVGSLFLLLAGDAAELCGRKSS